AAPGGTSPPPDAGGATGMIGGRIAAAWYAGTVKTGQPRADLARIEARWLLDEASHRINRVDDAAIFDGGDGPAHVRRRDPIPLFDGRHVPLLCVTLKRHSPPARTLAGRRRNARERTMTPTRPMRFPATSRTWRRASPEGGWPTRLTNDAARHGTETMRPLPGSRRPTPVPSMLPTLLAQT